MTMACCDTPITRTAPTAGEMAKASVGRLVGKLQHLAQALADHSRNRRDQAALDALPFDLRKDLGWPAGDMRR